MASFGNDSQPDKNQFGCYQIKKVGKFWLLKVNERSMRIKFLDHAKDVFIEENFLIADDEIFEINDNESGELSIKKVEEFLHNPIECDLSSEDVNIDQNENLFEVGNAEIDKAIEIENENLDKDVNKDKANSAPSDMAVSLSEVETFDKSVLQRLFPDISVKQKNHKDWMTDFEKEIDSHLKTLKQQSASSSDIAVSLSEMEIFDKSVLQRLFPDISVRQKNHKDWMTDFEKQIDSHLKTLKSSSDMAASLNEVETFDKSMLQRLFPDISVKQKNHKNWMTDFEKEIDSYLKTLKQQSAPSSDMAAILNKVETFDKSVLQRLFPDISVKQKSHKDWMTDFEKQIDSHLKTLKSSSIKNKGRILELQATVKFIKEERSSLIAENDRMVLELRKRDSSLHYLKNCQKAEEKKWQESLKAKELELQQAKKEVLKSKEEVLKAAGNQKDKYCMKCMDTITDPVRLNCGHNFCKDCIDEQFQFKPECPTCGHVCGVITGNQPEGDMRCSVERFTDCTGYTGVGRIVITYIFFGGRQGPDHPNPGTPYKGITRVAYLPNNDEGRKILAMLEIAFKRKLVFTIGKSRTTGQEGVITWNDIHHKTNPRPHQQFGYPDPDYLEKVKDELAAKGVTEKDIKIQ